MIPTFQRVIKRPHRVYTHKEIDDVLNSLTQPELPRGAIPQISRDTGMPYQTPRDWHRQRIQEAGENWFPSAQGQRQTRALSAVNEAVIVDFIQVNHIETSKGATRGFLKSLCLVCHVQQNDHERHRNDLERQPRSYALLRIAMAAPSELCTISDAQRSTKHMLITFSGDYIRFHMTILLSLFSIW
jgi:hypothetical protein